MEQKMRCSHCGAEVNGTDVFCGECGTTLNINVEDKREGVDISAENNSYTGGQSENVSYEEPVTNEYGNGNSEQGEPKEQHRNTVTDVKEKANELFTKAKDGVKGVKSKMTHKTFTKICVGVLAVIVVIVACCIVFNKPAYEKTETTINVVYSEKEEAYIIIENDKFLDYKIESDDVYVIGNSINGKVVVLMTAEDDLYVINNGKLTKVDSEVNHAVLSVVGKGIVYTNYDNELRLCFIGGTSVKIADNVDSCDFTISPDGKTVIWINSDGETYVASSSNDAVKLGENLIPVSVSDSGKYIYCLDNEDNNLYVLNRKGEKNKIANDVEETIFLNTLQTQLMFKADDKWYVVEKTSDKVRVSSSSLFILIWPELIGLSSIVSSRDITYRSGEDIYAFTYPVSEFRNHYYADYSSSSLVYMDSKWETEKICKSIDSFDMSDSGDVIYYTDDGDLYRITKGKKEERIADDVASFKITSDGSGVYYIDDDDTLFYKKGTGKEKEIASDVDRFYVTHDDIVLFLTDYDGSSGIMFSSNKGSKAHRVADDVYSVIVTNTVTYYYAESDTAYRYDLYVATRGTNFRLLAEEVKE